jgi:hypothetical protein
MLAALQQANFVHRYEIDQIKYVHFTSMLLALMSIQS